jgi:hypothetical protein
MQESADRAHNQQHGCKGQQKELADAWRGDLTPIGQTNRRQPGCDFTRKPAYHLTQREKGCAQLPLTLGQAKHGQHQQRGEDPIGQVDAFLHDRCNGL